MRVAVDAPLTRETSPAAPHVSILDVMDETALLGEHFAGSTFAAWRVFLAALFALPAPDDAQRGVYHQCTGRETWPSARFREAVLVCGRRGGKTLICALVLVYLALFRRYTLPTGTVPLIMAIAADRQQALVLMRYMRGLLESVPVLADQVAEFKKESIEFKNGVVVRVQTASHRTTRGYTVVGCVCDEVAFWQTSDAAAVPDREVLAAIRPAMATVPDPLLLIISSPYRQQGELWRLYDKHFGRNGSKVLVWQADTKTMNPSVPDDVIADAYDEDPAAAAAEYGAQFRTDLSDFLSEATVRACVDAGVTLRERLHGVTYRAFVDASGGSGKDSMTLAIGHTDRLGLGPVHVLDVLIEKRPPFSPDVVVNEFVQMCRAYGVTAVYGDRYGGKFVQEPFTRLGVRYIPVTEDRSTLYLATLPLFNSGRLRLLDQARLVSQFTALERRTTPNGVDKVDHPRNGHDDVANAAAGVLATMELHPSRGPFALCARVEALL